MQNRTPETGPDVVVTDGSVRAKKDIALKILLDYTAVTGRKWGKLCDEMLSLLQLEYSPNAPPLFRQDLESWAAGKSVLGDQKFRIVVDFLTHPETLARAEFTQARKLLERPQKVAHVGNAFMEFFGYDSIANFRPFMSPSEVFADDAQIPDQYDPKTFAFNAGEVTVTVSFRSLPNELFYVVHVLVWLYGTLPTDIPKNLHVRRLSGFGLKTPNGIRACLRNELSGAVDIVDCHFVSAPVPIMMTFNGPLWERALPEMPKSAPVAKQVNNKVVELIVDELMYSWTPEW